MNDAQKSPANGVITVVLAYALFAGLWVLWSDQALGLLWPDADTLVQASIAKDGVFVALTSGLLFVMLRRLTSTLARAQQQDLAPQSHLQQAPPMLVATADASSDAIFAKDDAGRYLLFNNAAARFVGQPAQAALGHDDRAIFPPEQAKEIMERDRRIRSSGQAETTEETLQSADGDRVLLANKGPLRDAAGRIFGTYGITRDITERKREEEAVQRLADDLNATLQAIPDPLFEFDAEGRCLKVRSVDLSLLVAPPEQLLGRLASEVLPADAAATLLQALKAAGRSGCDYGRTMTVPMAAGERQFEISACRKPQIAGQPDHFIVLLRDISARSAAEAELRQRNQDLERINRAMIERELRMVALKCEVNQMARAAGFPAPYDTSFVIAPAALATL